MIEKSRSRRDLALPKTLVKLAQLKRACLDKEEYTILNRTIKKALNLFKASQRLKWLRHEEEVARANDANGIWRWIRNAINGEQQPRLDGPLLNKETGMLITTTADKLKTTREHIAALAVRKAKEMCLDNPESNADLRIAELMNALITWSELLETLKRCKSNKATGMDGIPGEIYKMAEMDERGSSNLGRAMLNIANYSLDAGNIPEKWNECTVVPIFEKGDATLLDNY